MLHHICCYKCLSQADKLNAQSKIKSLILLWNNSLNPLWCLLIFSNSALPICLTSFLLHRHTVFIYRFVPLFTAVSIWRLSLKYGNSVYTWWRFVLSYRGVIPQLWFCCSVTGIRLFFNYTESNYLTTAYSPIFTCCSLCFDLFILVFSLLGLSALVLAFQLITHKHCLQILNLRMLIVTWNRFPIKKLWRLIRICRLCRHQLFWKQICAFNQLWVWVRALQCW